MESKTTYSKSRATKFGLRPSDLDRIVQILKSNPKVNELLIFGSRSKGNFRPSSDVDIAIKGEGLTLNDLLNLSNSLDELWLPYRVDLVDFSKINEPDLIHHIERVGGNLYKRN